MSCQGAEPGRRVCIPVDGSKDSNRAFEYYLEHISKPTDIVIIITAQELLNSACGQPPYGGLAFYEEFHHIMEHSDDRARDLLKHYGAILTSLKMKFKLIKEVGRAGEIICLNNKEENGTLIIMGCRGLTTTKRTFLGSVSDYVVHNAHTAVLVIPPPLDRKDHSRADAHASRLAQHNVHDHHEHHQQKEHKNDGQKTVEMHPVTQSEPSV